MNKYIATFYTHYGAIKFHRYCKKHLIPAKPAPTPRSLGASCGVCIRFESSDSYIAEDHEDLEACYLVLGDGDGTRDGSYKKVLC